MVWRCDGEVVAVHHDAQRFFFELGLLHQPMRQPPQQVEMRAAAFIAARPQPDVVGQQQRDAALLLAREHQQRLAVGPVHHACVPVVRLVLTRRNQWLQCGGSVLRALQAARHRMALAEIGQGRAWNGCSVVSPLGSAGRMTSSGVRQMLVGLA